MVQSCTLRPGRIACLPRRFLGGNEGGVRGGGGSITRKVAEERGGDQAQHPVLILHHHLRALQQPLELRAPVLRFCMLCFRCLLFRLMCGKRVT